MAYRDFSWEELRLTFGITSRVERLFGEITPVAPSTYLSSALDLAKRVPLRNEKAKSEAIVYPILLDAIQRNDFLFTLYSGENLNIDRARGLAGEIDFFLAKRTSEYGINFPIVAVVEAKKNDFDLGIPQCAAQMLGGMALNELESHRGLPLYGCVTTGEEWRFMRLDNTHFTLDEKRYRLDRLEELLGVIQHILDFYRQLFTNSGQLLEEPLPAYKAMWT